MNDLQPSLHLKKSVLDVCCGSRMFWFDREDRRAVFCDKRSEHHELTDCGAKAGVRSLVVEPDIVADFAKLPFPNESFALVVFDPPHMKAAGLSGWLAKKYGKLDEDWELVLSGGFRECFRVLKPEGTLIFKWNESQIPLSQIMSLSPVKPLFGNKCGRQSKTHWVVFLKPSHPSKPILPGDSSPCHS